MRIVSMFSIIGVGLALLSGAAQAETAFPTGKEGQGDFQLFPRWQRVLAEGGSAIPVKGMPSSPAQMLPIREDSADDQVADAPFYLPPPAAFGPDATPRLTPIPLNRPDFTPLMRAQLSSVDVAPTQPSIATTQADTHCHADQDCTLDDWQSIISTARPLPRKAQLEQINTWANNVRYVDDLSNWAMSDYWQTPEEFITRGGDCEDYAITKYFGLTELGFAAEDMRIMVLFDEQLQLHHAVLLVHMDGDIWLLDNQKSSVVLFSEVSHYRPVYSVNASNWWMHKTLAPVRLTLAQPVRIASRGNARRRFR